MKASHSAISPSRARRIELCPASMRLEPEAEARGLAISGYEEAAKEGQEEHEAIEDGDGATDLSASCEDFRETVAPLSGMLSEVRERHIVLVDQSGLQVLCEGTADYVAHYEDKIILIDWKMGHEDPDLSTVELQLALYAAGLMDHRPVIAYVFCPRSGFSRSWIFLGRNLILARLETIIAAAEKQPETQRPGYVQCRYCSAKSICPAWKRQLPSSPLEKLPVAPEEIARLLEVATIAAPWAQAVKKAAREAMAKGQDIPGWRVRSVKRRTVADWPRLLSEISLHAPEEEVEKAVRGSLEMLREAYVMANKGPDCTVTEARKEFDALITPYCKETETQYLQRITQDGTETRATEKILDNPDNVTSLSPSRRKGSRSLPGEGS